MRDPSDELAAIQQRLAKAWVDADRATIEAIIAPDWIVTGADGRLSSRADVMRDVFETGVHRMAAIEIDDVHVRPFGDAAVVTGRTQAAASTTAFPTTSRSGSPTCSSTATDGGRQWPRMRPCCRQVIDRLEAGQHPAGAYAIW